MKYEQVLAKFLNKRALYNYMGNKRGISPVIATVLLIGIVVVIGLIVFMWFRGISEEAITKFENKNVRLVCDDISLETGYSFGNLYVSNSGNVPVYQLKIKTEGVNSNVATINHRDYDWPRQGLLQGLRTNINISEIIDTKTNRLSLIPVLIGSTEDNVKKTHVCDERHAIEVIIE
jgi:flagellin-like protein